MCSCLNVRQTDAFSSPVLKRSDSMAGSRDESGSEFQTVGPATGKVRVPKVLRRNHEYSVCDGWLSGDVCSRKLQRLTHSNRRGTQILRLKYTRCNFCHKPCWGSLPRSPRSPSQLGTFVPHSILSHTSFWGVPAPQDEYAPRQLKPQIVTS